MKSLIIGANGKIGKLVCQKYAAKKFQLVAMIRNMGQADWFTDQGIEITHGDLEDNFSTAFAGCDRVVFTAGSGGHTGGDKTLLIDLYGAIRAIDYCKEINIKHFIMVSSRRAENPMQTPVNIRHYMVAKKLADDYLQQSGIDYTILRPGRLTDKVTSGNFVQESHPGNPDNLISREMVADYIVECLVSDVGRNEVIPMLNA